MAGKRLIVALASLFWLAINPAWAGDGIPANSQALSEQAKVKLYRLHYAKADLSAKELLRFFPDRMFASSAMREPIP